MNGRRERELGPSAKGGREPSRRARILVRWKAPRPFGKRRPSRDGVGSGSSAGCRSVGSLQPRRSGQLATRVLERKNEEGSSLRRALCSGLSAHAGSAAKAAPAAHHPASRKRTRRWGRGEASRVSLPVVWVTSRHGNAKRLALGRRRTSRARMNRTHGVPARRKCVAEVGGRRFGSEKRRRSAPLTRRSGDCVAGGLARRVTGHSVKPVESARRAKKRREVDRGGKVARSPKDGVEPEDAITCRWKASRVVDIA